MTTQNYRFGDYKLLPSERLLFRRGSEVALTARAFELLVAFVERAGQLVAKDDLLRRVWAGLVVEENNLAVQVGVLRRLLGAEAITTIPSFGYRFALPVLDVAEAPEASRGRLPLRLPALIGRDAEGAELLALLRNHAAVTLCGGPGVGKTRLAQELALRSAPDMADGAWWVDLTLLRDDEPVAAAVARALGLPGQTALATLAARLATLQLLIVLDNAEHRAADVAEVVTALVRDTSRVSLLITSQLPLQAQGEHVWRLPPMSLADAMRLLALRSGGTQVGEARAAEICQALDCNPLAIELAASRLDALGPDGLAARLHERLTLLAPSDARSPSRRNALGEALSWSHELLSERERRVLRRLAVFPGSFSLEGAALVLADEQLPAAAAVAAVLSLVERSLVAVDRGTQQRRFRLLETMRLFALDKLAAAGETALAQARHCAGLRWLLDDAYEESWRLPHAAWKARYEAELPGLWAALAWATEHELASAVALFGAAAPLWMPRATQARPHALALAARLAGDAAMPRPELARFWSACARCHSVVHPGMARDAAERAARLYRELGDERGEYLALVEHAFNWRVDGPEARATLAAARMLENPGWPAAVLERGLTTEAVLHLTSGRHDEARRCYQAALALCERGGFDAGVMRARLNLADQARAAGELDLAVQLGEALLAEPGDAGDLACLASITGNLIGALVAQGRFERAREVALAAPGRLGRLAMDDQLWVSLDALALLHLHAGRTELAAQLAGAADREFEAHGQMQRQPNEAADRATLAAGLAARLSAAGVERLAQEGRRMSLPDAMRAAFAL